MTRVLLDKIASVTSRLQIGRHAVLGSDIPAVPGTVVACRVLTAKTAYNTLENLHGRMVTLQPGDVIAGALGHRDALHGFAGRVPDAVEVGDKLQLLNLGGVIGTGATSVPGLGSPFELEVLGAILHFPHFGERVGVPANIAAGALPAAALPERLPPVLVLAGTSMDAGKTTAAAAIVAGLTARGLRVAAGKMTGVSLRRDILQMEDCGAAPVSLFTDFGVVTTNEQNAVAAGHSLIAHLAESEPDVIALELGDGLLGTYGVRALLSDAPFRRAISAMVLCASDPVGVWGAVQLLKERWNLRPAVVSGPVTDSPVGQRFCREELGLQAWNALKSSKQLVRAVVSALGIKEPLSVS